VLWWGLPLAVALLAAVLFWGLPALGMPSVVNWFQPRPAAGPASPPTALSGARLVDGSLELPPEVAARLVGSAVEVQQVGQPRPLELSGSLAFDPDRLYRIQSRFGGEVINLDTIPEPGSPDAEGRTRYRAPRYGDRVKKGDLLAVVLSKDLGEKKSELVNNLVQLHVDELALRRYEDLAAKGYLPEATLLQQRATVASDRNAVVRVERTLLTWRVDQREIEVVKTEARRIQDNQSLRDLAKETKWAEVEVRAPADGVIVEKNVAPGNIVDTTFDLFKVADLSVLSVVVHAYEEDLKALRRLGLPYTWTVRVAAQPGRELQRPGADRFTAPAVAWSQAALSPYGAFVAAGPAPYLLAAADLVAVLKLQGPFLEQLGKVVDPNQHTAPVMGRVDNRGRDLDVGQFVTATVELPAPPDVVSLPAAALDEDGESSVVFVQPDPSRPVYALRRVLVTQRLGSVVYAASSLTTEQKKQGLREILPGEHVVPGVVSLKATLEELQARQKHK
jgi:cobalt-zinc-cadmium efflux system membrane fusion protein